MVLRLVIGLGATVIAMAIAGRRVWWLFRLLSAGQPAPGRLDGVGQRLRAEVTEVIGQKRLLSWSVPGLAHAFTFWGFLILGATILEAYGALFDKNFHIPLIGTWGALGFIEDFFAVAVLAGLATFVVLRRKQDPARIERSSRFYGSHTTAAWQILGMIFLVILTLLIYRGAQVNTGVFPFDHSWWAFASQATGKVLAPLGTSANEAIETIFVLGQIIVIMAFLVILVYSKHLHIALAPINVATKRIPQGLGALLPMESGGKPVNFEDPGEDDIFGRGKIEDFTWKGMLDFATCTECGRCQSQCPAWNTAKPLSPKLVIMDLRDHLFAKAPYLIGGREVPAGATIEGAQHGHGVPESGFGRVLGSGPEQAVRPLVGTIELGGVIDPDVLWSCTTCGACVEQCPVDIEHVDHIVDMRRYQVLVESNFPAEAGVMLRNLESKGNPWGAPPNTRADWTKGLDFPVPRATDGDDFEYLFWVGCAGAFDDGAKKTTRAVATLLHEAGVSFAILGEGETCTGDPARRMGNEFVFQMLGAAERGDPQRGVRGPPVPQDRRHLRALLQHPGQRVRAAGRSLRGHAPHPAAVPPGLGRGAHPDRADRGRRDLPRPVLPGPAQPDLRGPAGAARGGHRRRGPRRGPVRGDGAVRRAFVLLRRRRIPDVDGRADRQADQHRAGRGGRPDRGPDRGRRLPVLPDHADRRGHLAEVQRTRRGRRGRGRRDGPAPGGQAGLSSSPRSPQLGDSCGSGALPRRQRVRSCADLGGPDLEGLSAGRSSSR